VEFVEVGQAVQGLALRFGDNGKVLVEGAHGDRDDWPKEQT
jgi:hypothetical protein